MAALSAIGTGAILREVGKMGAKRLVGMAVKKRLMRSICTNKVPAGKLANHIFSGKAGKLLDTSYNRKLIESVVNKRKYFIGFDEYGKNWFSKILPNGSQIHAYSKNGVVKGAGINKIPLDIVKNKGLIK